MAVGYEAECTLVREINVNAEEICSRCYVTTVQYWMLNVQDLTNAILAAGFRVLQEWAIFSVNQFRRGL